MSKVATEMGYEAVHMPNGQIALLDRNRSRISYDVDRKGVRMDISVFIQSTLSIHQLIYCNTFQVMRN